MPEIQKFEKEIGGEKLIIEIGQLAKQTNGSCTVRYGDTVILATVVASENIREDIDYFPLSVEYEERLYAAGKIKGSRFIKREGRPSDTAIITARLVDRAIRPLFDQRIRNDIQVILTTLSFDHKNSGTLISLIAASVALTISDIPWAGPITGVRIGRINGEWILNPTYEARAKSDIDLIVAGTRDRVIMLEMAGNEIKEEVLLKAIEFGQKHIGKIINFIKEVEAKVGKPKNLVLLEGGKKLEADEKETALAKKEEIKKREQKFLDKNLEKTLFLKEIKTKADRLDKIKELEQNLEEELKKEEIGKEKKKGAFEMFQKLIKEKISKIILEKEKRVDGRKLEEIRPLSSQVGLLPCTHGSALFSRGETQILSVLTLGGPGEEQLIETVEEESKKSYMHHYNFPPFAVGEVAPIRGVGRREIGHGVLAEKALIPVLPPKEEFPYTIRVVSEVLESNGSSSMASVSGSSLALMDGGVPIKKAVAGIAMGLASEEDESGEIQKYKILTDIQDLEDGPGGMDFKAAGTYDGITAIQMDTKTHGLTLEIIKNTFEKALKARLEIIEAMNKTISAPRKELSPYAPRVTVFHIDPEKIRDVIGPGGKIINEIISKTGVAIDIENDGMVAITSTSQKALEKAVDWIKDLTREAKVGETFQGKVTRILDFGAFVEIFPGQEGLVHISELDHRHINNVKDVVQIGDIVPVKVIKIDEQGRVNLSMKALKPAPAHYQGYSREFSKKPGQKNFPQHRY